MLDSEKFFSQVFYVTVQLKIATCMPLENNHQFINVLGILSSSTLTDIGTTSSVIFM